MPGLWNQTVFKSLLYHISIRTLTSLYSVPNLWTDDINCISFIGLWWEVNGLCAIYIFAIIIILHIKYGDFGGKCLKQMGIWWKKRSKHKVLDQLNLLIGSDKHIQWKFQVLCCFPTFRGKIKGVCVSRSLNKILNELTLWHIL